MKKMIFTLIAMLTMAMNAGAMSYEQARNEALFLTDKMAYELNLSDSQYEAAYEINLDYLMSVTGYDDVNGIWWERRNTDMRYILYSWQWEAFCAASYFYRPLYWDAGYWHFGIYARYPRRDYFYFGQPHFYATYRGGHSWHMNGGHSFYEHHREAFRPGQPTRDTHVGMRNGWDRGNYRNVPHGNSSTRVTAGDRGQGNRGYRNNDGRGYSGNGSRDNGFRGNGGGTYRQDRDRGGDRGGYNGGTHDSGSRNNGGNRSDGGYSGNRSNDRGSYSGGTSNSGTSNGGGFSGGGNRSNDRGGYNGGTSNSGNGGNFRGGGSGSSSNRGGYSGGTSNSGNGGNFRGGGSGSNSNRGGYSGGTSNSGSSNRGGFSGGGNSGSSNRGGGSGGNFRSGGGNNSRR